MTLFTASLAMIFLLPLGYMILTSVKDSAQMTALNAPLWPASPQMYTAADGQVYTVYEVPTANGVQDLALEKPGRVQSTFIDPKTGQEVAWQGNWRSLSPVWSLNIKFDNFTTVLNVLNFPMLLRNTLIVAILGTIGAVTSAVLVAYGFARFRIPGKNGLFLVMIMTIMLPFQVLLIPQYIGFKAIGWTGTWLPLIVPHFFANAYNVFLLRQYFLTLPRELDQAAQVDGASPLRILWSVIIPAGVAGDHRRVPVPLLLHVERLLRPARVPVGTSRAGHDDGRPAGLQRHVRWFGQRLPDPGRSSPGDDRAGGDLLRRTAGVPARRRHLRRREVAADDRERQGPEVLSGPAPYAWRRPIGLPYDGPERARQDVNPPLIDDGPWGGVPLGGLGAGSIGRTHRGDFARWHLDVGRHRFETIPADQFSVYVAKGGAHSAHVLSTIRPETLPSWNWDLPEEPARTTACFPMPGWNTTGLSFPCG